MGSYQAGTTITLEGWFKNERTGTFVDPDAGTKKLQVFKDGSLVKEASDAEIKKLITGKYYYEWDTPDTLDKGLYVYEFSAKVNGLDAVDSAIFRIRQRKRT